MKNVYGWCIAAAMLVTATQAGAQNLLTNPGWDDDLDGTGWAIQWQDLFEGEPPVRVGGFDVDAGTVVAPNSAPNALVNTGNTMGFSGSFAQDILDLPATPTELSASIFHTDNGGGNKFDLYVYGLKSEFATSGVQPYAAPDGIEGFDYDVLVNIQDTFHNNDSWAQVMSSGFTVDSATYPNGLRFRVFWEATTAGGATYQAFDDAAITPYVAPPLIVNGSFDDPILQANGGNLNNTLFLGDGWVADLTKWDVVDGVATKIDATSHNLVQVIEKPAATDGDADQYYRLSVDYRNSNDQLSVRVLTGGPPGGNNWFPMASSFAGDNFTTTFGDITKIADDDADKDGVQNGGMANSTDWETMVMEFDIPEDADSNYLFIAIRQFSGLGAEVDNVVLELVQDTGMLAGDANGDGQVDGNDLISVEENFGSTGEAGIPGDANGDGQVDGNDLISVEENFGSTSSATSTVIYDSSVPEPATMALLGLGGLALIRRRK